MIDVQGVYFGYYGFKPTVRVSTHDDLRIGQENIILNDAWCIVILNGKPYLSGTYTLELTFGEKVCIIVVPHQ